MKGMEDLLMDFAKSISREIRTRSLNFPTSFDVLIRIKRLLERPNSSIKDFAGAVQTEPVISAKLLRMANSVAFNPYGSKVTTVNEAINRVGLKSLRCLVQLVITEQVIKDCRSTELKMLASQVWAHSVDVASWAYAIAKEYNARQLRPDEAMLGGVMVDIGQFFLIARLSKFPAIEADENLLITAIQSHHQDATSQLLEIFKMPAEIARANEYDIGECHSLWPIRNVSDIVFLATLASNAPNPFLEKMDNCRVSIFECTDLDFPTTQIRAFLEKVRPERDAMHGFLSNEL